MDGTVLHISLALILVEVGDGVLHPLIVVAIGIILVSVSAAALLPLLGAVHGGGGVAQEVATFERFDEVGVPDERLVGNLDVGELLDDVINLGLALGQEVGRAVDGGVLLHDGLHVRSDLGGRRRSLGVAEPVEIGHGFHPRVGSGVGDGIARLGNVGNAEGTGTAKDDNVKEGVGTETVGTVDGGAGRFSGGEEAGYDLIVHEVTSRNQSSTGSPHQDDWSECHPCCNGRWAGREWVPW